MFDFMDVTRVKIIRIKLVQVFEVLRRCKVVESFPSTLAVCYLWIQRHFKQLTTFFARAQFFCRCSDSIHDDVVVSAQWMALNFIDCYIEICFCGWKLNGKLMLNASHQSDSITHLHIHTNEFSSSSFSCHTH